MHIKWWQVGPVGWVDFYFIEATNKYGNNSLESMKARQQWSSPSVLVYLMLEIEPNPFHSHQESISSTFYLVIHLKRTSISTTEIFHLNYLVLHPINTIELAHKLTSNIGVLEISNWLDKFEFFLIYILK